MERIYIYKGYTRVYRVGIQGVQYYKGIWVSRTYKGIPGIQYYQGKHGYTGYKGVYKVYSITRVLMGTQDI